jgi:endonuclease YncB( thermonuclease family)
VYSPPADNVASSPSDAGQPAAEAAPSEPQQYLLAFKDHTIYAALAYWVDGDTLHYFTSGNTHNQVSLSLVDKALTERLNREAGTEVRLP